MPAIDDALVADAHRHREFGLESIVLLRYYSKD